MNQCSQCGKDNIDGISFCRYCGTRMAQIQREAETLFQAPRPYAWKTDKYQTQTEARVQPAQPFGNGFQSGTIVPSFGTNYRCPNCGTSTLPITERRISTPGWIVFSILLVFTVVFFWIGLLMKENVNACPVCGVKLA